MGREDRVTPEERMWLMLIAGAAVVVIGLCVLYSAIYYAAMWLGS